MRVHGVMSGVDLRIDSITHDVLMQSIDALAARSAPSPDTSTPPIIAFLN